MRPAKLDSAHVRGSVSEHEVVDITAIIKTESEM